MGEPRTDYSTTTCPRCTEWFRPGRDGVVLMTHERIVRAEIQRINREANGVPCTCSGTEGA